MDSYIIALLYRTPWTGLSVPMGKLSYNDKLRMQTLREQGLGEKAIISSYPDKGVKVDRALLRKSEVESTTLAQPFCINQAVGDLPQRMRAQFVVVRQFSHW